MGRFEDLVLKPALDARNGNLVAVPLHLERVNENLMLRRKVYTLIGSNAGSGKSAFIDSTYILEPYERWRKDKELGITNDSFKSIYIAAERPEAEKLAKWACWKLYKDYNMYIDVETFMGYRKHQADKQSWDRFVGVKDWVEELLDHVDLKCYTMTPNEYQDIIKYHALKDGVWYCSDTIGVKNMARPQEYEQFFVNAKKRIKSSGEVVDYLEVTDLEGKIHEMQPGKQLYFPRRPKEIVSLVYDHLGKAKGEGTKKDKIDAISQNSADARDVFGYSPVIVSQFNRAVGNMDRIKHYGSDLSPNLDDFKDSNGPVEDKIQYN